MNSAVLGFIRHFITLVAGMRPFTAELARIIWEKFKVDTALVFKNESLEVTVRVSAADAVYLSDFDGSRRMTEWDVVTDLASASTVASSFPPKWWGI